MNRLYLFFILLCFTSMQGQYTEMLNSNRPGGSQGSFSVGTGVLQFESGLTFGQQEHVLKQTQTSLVNWDYAVRYGIWKEALEISFMGSFEQNAITYTHGSAQDDVIANFKSNTLGLKYLVYDPYRKQEAEGPNLYSWKQNNRFQWRDFIPAVAVYAGANFDFADNPLLPPNTESGVHPKLVVSTQNNWIGGFVFVTNLFADRITTDFPTYGYILTLTHATNEFFSIFIENQGFMSDFYADQIFRGGVAALVTPDLQFDGSLSLNMKDTPGLFYGRLGISYRIDRHDRDEYIEEKGKEARQAKRNEKNSLKRAKKLQKKQRKDMKRQKKKSFILDDSLSPRLN